jgi:hypothetical protein
MDSVSEFHALFKNFRDPFSFPRKSFSCIFPPIPIFLFVNDSQTVWETHTLNYRSPNSPASACKSPSSFLLFESLIPLPQSLHHFSFAS